MKLSNKKKSELYKIVSDEIIDARIKIARLTNNIPAVGNSIDKVLYELSISAPQKAVDLFDAK